jgi:hypothetical protein
MEQWRGAERPQVEALLEVREALTVCEENRLGEASASRRVQNPRNLATLLHSICSGPCNRLNGWASMPVSPLQDGCARATRTFGFDVGGDLSEAFVNDQFVAIGHVHQPGICRGSEPCRQEKRSIAKSI